MYNFLSNFLFPLLSIVGTSLNQESVLGLVSLENVIDHRYHLQNRLLFDAHH